MTPSVTVIIPVFRRSAWIRRAYESILSQTLQDWEILCVQDGEDVAVTRAVKDLVASDMRVKHLQRGCEGSIGAACNYALERASGQFVAILDDDDEWIDADKLRLQVDFLRRNLDYIGCGGGYRSLDQHGNVLGRYYKPQSDSDIRRRALVANPMANSTTMFRREAALGIGGYCEEIRNFQDWEFWLRCLRRGKLYNFHRIWLNYTVWDGGSSFVNIRSNAAAAVYIVDKHKDSFPFGAMATVLAKSYELYSWLPMSLLRVSHKRLSILKKTAFSARMRYEVRRHKFLVPRNPTVSVIVPCLNGAQSISDIIECFLGSRNAEVVEILVVDGGSQDQTREIVRRRWAQVPVVQLLENVFRHKSHALNLGIARAKGDVVLVADTHARYSGSYVEKCLEALVQTGAANVGGAQRYLAFDRIQYFTAITVRCRAGSGGARYKDPTFSGFAETVYLGCFLREALLEVGRQRLSRTGRRSVSGELEIFSESNVTNQDAEINERLAELVEDPVYVSSEIVVHYLPRSSWVDVVTQFWHYGRGRCITSFRGGRVVVRGNLPFAVLVACLSLAVLDLLYPVSVLWLAVLAGFLWSGADCARGVFEVRKEGQESVWRSNEAAPGWVVTWLGTWLMTLTMNCSHGLGFVYQLVRIVLKRQIVW